MCNHKILYVMILTAIAGGTHTATADVIKLTDDATLQQSQGERYFSQSGVSGEVVEPLETVGAGMALPLATKLIVPNNWVVKPSGNYDRAKVSFKGGVSWPHILRNIAQDEGIFISLDWVKKIVSIHVPGETKSQEAQALLAKQKLDSQRQSFYKDMKPADAGQPSPFFAKKNAATAPLQPENKTASTGTSIVAAPKEAQVANTDYINKLSSTNAVLEKDLQSLKMKLAAEQTELKLLKDRYAVIDPKLSTKPAEKPADATELFSKFSKLWVKPFDDSFMYYKNGGHAEILEAKTPATFVAKKGSVEEVITQWGAAVNWHVEYAAGVQHHNPFQVSFKGTFFEASTELVRVFEQSNRPINITFYPDVNVEMPDGTVRHGLAKITDLNYTQ